MFAVVLCTVCAVCNFQVLMLCLWALPASGAVAVLEAKRDALARRLDGLLRCKDEFAELARCL